MKGGLSILCITVILSTLVVVTHQLQQLQQDKNNNARRLAAAAAWVEQNPEAWRLIEVAEGERLWMQRKDMLRNLTGQAGKRSHFFDVTDLPLLGPDNAPQAPAFPTNPKQQAVVDALKPSLKTAQLRDTIQRLSDFFTRYYTTQTGKDAAVYLYNKYKEFGKEHPDVEVTFFNHTWLQPSVIARIKGTGPNAHEKVIVGGHEDSIYNGANGRAPGADDDASGSSTVLEVFRVLAQHKFKPKRTIEFHAYAAEEVGLRGSQAIADAYKKQGVVVAGMMQLDMTAYLRSGSKPVISVIQDYVSLPLSQFVEKLVTSYSSLPVVTEKCGYACSDHASWYKAGYPASYPFESLEVNQDPYIHTPNDSLDRINLEHALEIAAVALGFAVELSLDV